MVKDGPSERLRLTRRIRLSKRREKRGSRSGIITNEGSVMRKSLAHTQNETALVAREERMRGRAQGGEAGDRSHSDCGPQ